MRPQKIISGAQTGADQGALVAAHLLGIPTGGYCPKNCRTEAGDAPHLIPLYGLIQMASAAYPPRTKRNAQVSDGTAWFGRLNSRGYHATRDACDLYEKPFRAIGSPEGLREFILEFNIKILNGAGNRASKNPGIDRWTAELIIEAFKPDLL